MRFKKDRRGVAPLFVVAAVLVVIGLVFGGMYYLYQDERQDRFHWPPGVTNDNAYGYITCDATVVKDYNGVSYQIVDDNAPYFTPGLPEGAVDFSDWLLNRAQSVPDDLRVVFTVDGNGWEMTETIYLDNWKTVTANDGSGDYLVCNPVSMPFIVTDGLYHIEYELERNVGGNWVSLQTISTTVQTDR